MSKDRHEPAKKPKIPPSAKAARPQNVKAAREERLAQNLRDNLRRRKAAARKLSGGE